MIPYYALYIVLGIIGFLLQPISLLPDVVLDPNITNALAQAGQFMNVIGAVIPLTLGALLVAVAGMVTISLAIFGYKFIKWIYTKIPGVS